MFECTTITQGDAVIATLQGEATPVTAESFESALLQLASKKPRLLVLDLTGLQFVSSFAVAAMLRAESVVRAGGGRVRIASPTEYVRGLILTTRADQRMPMFETVAEAIAA